MWCFKAKKIGGQEEIALNEQFTKDEKAIEEKNKRIQRNYAILRDDLYHGIMKPFFASGEDYKEFVMIVLKDDINANKAKIKQELLEGQPEKSFVAKYVIIDPKKSRFYQVWELFFLLVILVEFSLVPYTVCTDPTEVLLTTKSIEIMIDLIWTCNIIISFCTAFQKDVDTIDNWKEISQKYLREGFFTDIVSTLPMLLAGYYVPLPWLYTTKLLRFYQIKRAQRIIKDKVLSLEDRFSLSKQTIAKLDYFMFIMLIMLVMMHSVSCLWLFIGENLEESWIRNPDDGIPGREDASRATKYIYAFYWVVTTLATVGYGDIKGYTWQEYAFNMLVEFIGIAFFSFIMGSINNIFLVDSSSADIIESKLEQVDVWLVKLDNSRMSKSLPKILYDKIKLYIKESLHYDHKKIVDNCDYLAQLKPQLRFQLVMELFSKFIKEEFPHLFVHDIEQAGCQKTLSTGEEFISFFVSQLYCRVFIANQTIVKTGEQFAEMYMIFKGRVTLSLRVKDENEYFTLYSTNYFGDYQILMGLRSSECYKSSVDSQTYCHCLKKKELLDLMGTFPTARYIFTERAIQRRLEFRRIKKQYEIFADVHPNPEIDAIQITDASRFTIQTYNDKSKESEMPPFLTDPDFYFAKSELVQVKNEDVQEISDSEVQTRLTQDDIEEKQKERTKRSLDYLMKQIDLTNQALVQVKNKLSENAEKTVDFIDRINSGQDHVEIPTIDNLQNCLNELHAALPHFTAKS